MMPTHQAQPWWDSHALVHTHAYSPFTLLPTPVPGQINVFTLGAVFLQLAKLLRVTEHPMFAK